MISRRKLFGLLGSAAVGATLLVPHRTIFLPPRGGWPQQFLGQIIVPHEDLPYYADGIASGLYSYDTETEMMTLLKRIASHEPGKFHSARTGVRYNWDDVGSHARRSLVDDRRDFVPPSKQSIKQSRSFVGHPVPWLPKKTAWYTDDASEWGPPDMVEKLKADAILLGVPFVGESLLVDMDQWVQTDGYRDWMRQRGQSV